ncbi:MAG TPA: ThiF family adenylyltransferase [Gemmataceae bacterium]|jgi:molybdopterin/thiamine biosynthesis adenylyltransferase|nr:ThiF family adenylyltransferase [Gemmataceae bacterium]
MASKFHHEALYRGADNVARLAALRVTVCGAGALGSNLADNLARQGFALLRAIDRDRVEEHNVSTQLYAEADVGAWKVEVLRQRLFKATGIEIDALRKELTERSARSLLQDSSLVIDTFDNSASRRLVQETCRALQVPCLHIGLYADYGEVIWDEHYRVPQDVAGDVCDYPLARNLVLLVVALASEIVLRFALEGTRASWSATLQDFAVRPLETSAR